MIGCKREDDMSENSNQGLSDVAETGGVPKVV